MEFSQGADPKIGVSDSISCMQANPEYINTRHPSIDKT